MRLPAAPHTHTPTHPHGLHIKHRRHAGAHERHPAGGRDAGWRCRRGLLRAGGRPTHPRARAPARHSAAPAARRAHPTPEPARPSDRQHHDRDRVQTMSVKCPTRGGGGSLPPGPPPPDHTPTTHGQDANSHAHMYACQRYHTGGCHGKPCWGCPASHHASRNPRAQRTQQDATAATAAGAHCCPALAATAAPSLGLLEVVVPVHAQAIKHAHVLLQGQRRELLA